MQQIVVTYLDSKSMKSILRVKLPKGSDQAEFDLFFARIPNSNSGLDVTANWRSLNINNQGVFYTDSNGLGVVKRATD